MYNICVLHEPITVVYSVHGRQGMDKVGFWERRQLQEHLSIFALTLIKQPNQTVLELHDCDEKNEYSH